MLHGSGAWGHSLIGQPQSRSRAIDTVGRAAARGITGVPITAPGDSALLEANMIPTSILAQVNAVDAVLRFMRLFSGDPRSDAAWNPHPVPQRGHRDGANPVAFAPHPWAATYALIAEVHQEHGIPPHPLREMELGDQVRYAPWDTGPAANVHFFCENPLAETHRDVLREFDRDTVVGKDNTTNCRDTHAEENSRLIFVEVWVFSIFRDVGETHARWVFSHIAG